MYLSSLFSQRFFFTFYLQKLCLLFKQLFLHVKDEVPGKQWQNHLSLRLDLKENLLGLNWVSLCRKVLRF